MKITRILSMVMLSAMLMPAFVLPARTNPTMKVVKAAEMTCEDLKDLKLPGGATITVAETIVKKPIEEKPGIVVFGPDWKSPKSAFGEASVPVDFCRVAGVVDPAINFEVWLPLDRTHGALGKNGKYGLVLRPVGKLEVRHEVLGHLFGKALGIELGESRDSVKG